jgi:oligopeptide/dipeptide ABC transporter ATP-binding protein
MGSGKKILSLRDLKVLFPVREGVFGKIRGHIRAVDGVDLHLHEGDTLGLVGESGCGKSTLGRAVLRLENISSGELQYAGKDCLNIEGEALKRFRREVQIVFQDPLSSLNPRKMVLDLVGEALLVHKIVEDRKAMIDRVCELLSCVGMNHHALYRYPHEFSGGQRQRIAIARALALSPRLLVLDECVSALDVSVQAQVLNLLTELKTALGLTYIFISHDLAVVRFIATRVAVMYLGQIMEVGPVEELFSNPRHPYTIALLSSVPTLSESNLERDALVGDVPSPLSPPPGCPFSSRCPSVMAICREVSPRMKWIDSFHQCRCHLVEDRRRGVAHTNSVEQERRGLGVIL